VVFEGVITALVTPLRGGTVDEPALRDLVESQIAAGVDGLAPCGSTGESATLSHAEHRLVVEIAVSAARGRVPVLAGTGSNSTREAIELTGYAKQAGADGALLISPYYNKPTQEGIYAHYAAVAEETDFPIMTATITTEADFWISLAHPEPGVRRCTADRISLVDASLDVRAFKRRTCSSKVIS